MIILRLLYPGECWKSLGPCGKSLQEHLQGQMVIKTVLLPLAYNVADLIAFTYSGNTLADTVRISVLPGPDHIIH